MSIQGITKSRLFWPLVALFLLVMVNFWFNPDFFSIRIVKGGLYGSVIDIINRAAPVMLIAMGMTLVIATRGIDISVGATVAISGAIAAALIGGSLEIKDGVQTYVSQTPMALAILAALGVGLLCGLWNGFLVAGIGMQPIIATLILMVAGRGIAQLITGGQIVTIYYEPFFFFGNGFFLGIPFAIYLVVAVAAVLLLLVHKTALGLFIQAVGLNPTAARFSGISARALIFWVYGFCGVTAAVAGVIIASNVKSADGNGQAAGGRFQDALKLVTRLVNIGDCKSLACHPASTTHRQLSVDELAKAGVAPDMVRLSIGIEHIDDILADLDQALAAV